MRTIAVLLLLLTACQTDTRPVVSTDARPTQVNPISKPKGAGAVRGAVLYIDGISAASTVHQADNETMDILYWFEGGGFDVFRLDLSVSDQQSPDLERVISPNAVRQLRSRGYKRVYVVGQSAGGYLALSSIGRQNSSYADGAIAFAPGVSRLYSVQQQLAWHSELLSDLDQKKRVAIFMFKDDEVLGNWHADGVRIAKSLIGDRQNAMFRVPEYVTGHGGFQKMGFAKAYGDCLVSFLAAEVADASICPP
jgi:hypothetical protein